MKNVVIGLLGDDTKNTNVKNHDIAFNVGKKIGRLLQPGEITFLAIKTDSLREKFLSGAKNGNKDHNILNISKGIDLKSNNTFSDKQVNVINPSKDFIIQNCHIFIFCGNPTTPESLSFLGSVIEQNKRIVFIDGNRKHAEYFQIFSKKVSYAKNSDTASKQIYKQVKQFKNKALVI